MSSARVTTVAYAVLVEPGPGARASALVLKVLHSVQEVPPAPTKARRRAVMIVIGHLTDVPLAGHPSPPHVRGTESMRCYLHE